MTEQPDLAARRGYHHGNLREALLQAARQLVAERGPQGFTVTEAAKRAGVSPSAIYRHYRDREALLEELGRRGTALFAARLQAAAGAAADPDAALREMGLAYLAFAREEPGYYAAMFSFQPPGARAEGPPREGPFAGLVEAIRQVLPRGAEGRDARVLALQVWALSHGLAMLERAGLPPPGSGAPPPEALLLGGVSALLGVARIARAEGAPPG